MSNDSLKNNQLGSLTYHIIWRQFKKRWFGLLALVIFLALFLIGVYAPLFASSKPIVLLWRGHLYFPLFRYLFFQGFYTKPIDLFFNLLMFTLPIGVWIAFSFRREKRIHLIIGLVCAHFILYTLFLSGWVKDPEFSQELLEKRKHFYEHPYSPLTDNLLAPFNIPISWEQEKNMLTDYGKLNLLLKHRQTKRQHERLTSYGLKFFMENGREMPTLWNVGESRVQEKIERIKEKLNADKSAFILAKQEFEKLSTSYRPYAQEISFIKLDLEKTRNQIDIFSDHKHTEQFHQLKRLAEIQEKEINGVKQKALSLSNAISRARLTIEQYLQEEAHLEYIQKKRAWLEQEQQNLLVLFSPITRDFHWEEDAGGSQKMNQFVPWWERTRINRKDLMSSLLFGIRVSLVVGIASVGLSLLIGIPLGTISGYYAGSLDLIISRLVEIWEAMPTFFMLLLIVAITQTKSTLLVILVLGVFGWTTFCRFIRAEVLKQRSLPYVMACKSLGYRSFNVMFSQILPNAIAPILTLLPFSLMSVITSEAGLSFLGLGEEGSSSWGVLMDEGRSAFPSESYLLWPPALLLTLLLICIAIIGDVLRDALDPKMRR
jgi:peptide/nickel transport system permease protein